MYTIDKEKVKKILIEELGYTPGQAKVFIDDFPPIYEPLDTAVKQWLTDRTISDVTVEGMTIKEIMLRHSTDFLEAVQELDALLDPRMTSEHRPSVINMLKSPRMVKPHDFQ